MSDASRRGDGQRDGGPGGSHSDPEAQFAVSRDQKRARFKTRMVQIAASATRRRTW